MNTFGGDNDQFEKMVDRVIPLFKEFVGQLNERETYVACGQMILWIKCMRGTDNTLDHYLTSIENSFPQGAVNTMLEVEGHRTEI